MLPKGVARVSRIRAKGPKVASRSAQVLLIHAQEFWEYHLVERNAWGTRPEKENHQCKAQVVFVSLP
jgi:hypothetical protein